MYHVARIERLLAASSIVLPRGINGPVPIETSTQRHCGNVYSYWIIDIAVWNHSRKRVNNTGSESTVDHSSAIRF
jgi:hypothetical protein